MQYANIGEKKIYESLAGKPFTYQHNTEKLENILGHVEKAWVSKNEKGNVLHHLTDINTNSKEGKDYIEKVKRGDIKYVSIEAIPRDAEEIKNEGEKPYLRANLDEFIALSAVPIPGHRNSGITHIYAEKFGNKTEDKMTDEEKPKEPVEGEAKPEEDKKEEENFKALEEKLAKTQEALKVREDATEKLVKRLDSVEETIQKLEKKLEAKNKMGASGMSIMDKKEGYKNLMAKLK